MKKVLYVATVDVHIRTFHLPYLKMLHDNGCEVHVATNGDEKFPYCDVKHQICIERSPFKLSNIKAIKQLRKIIDTEKFDIIHCHTPMGSVVTRLAAKKSRKKYGTRVIYTAHGFHFYKGSSVLNWLMFFPIEWYLSKYTDTIITINHEDENLAKKYFSKRFSDIKYISGIGVDRQKFIKKMTRKEKKSKRNELGFTDDDFLIIFPARLDKNKNQLFLIKCMEKISKKYENVHLLFPGSDELNGFYQKVVKEKKLDKYVHFLGYRSDVNELLKISNLAVSSSIREGFGINLVEALMCGLPVIASRNRGHNDIIIDGNNGFLIDFDVDDFIKKFELIYNNKVKLNPSENACKFEISNSLEAVRRIYFEKK